jgi:predicted nucleic acid-binding protein
MPSKGRTVRRLYWDSCVFVSYIEKDAARFADIDAILDEARRGDVEIVTSVASIAEVAFTEAERLQRALNPVEEQRIGSLWTPPSPVRLVEFHKLIAEEARNLIRVGIPQGWQLKPYDALHLSTAKFMQVDRLETYDAKLPKFANHIGRAIGEPFISQPRIPHSTGP